MMDDSMLSLSWPLVTCSRGREGWVTVVSIQIPFDTSRFDTTKVDSILILCQYWTRFLIFASHTTAMDRRNVTPEQGMSSQKEKNLVCPEFSELFPLPKYAKQHSMTQSRFEGKLDEPHGGANRPIQNTNIQNRAAILNVKILLIIILKSRIDRNSS